MPAGGTVVLSSVTYYGVRNIFERCRRAGVSTFHVAGTVEETEAFLTRLRLVTHATSLGGVESLIERRARYAGNAAIVGPTLCRMSVGIEYVDDLWADLNGALGAAFG